MPRRSSPAGRSALRLVRDFGVGAFCAFCAFCALVRIPEAIISRRISFFLSGWLRCTTGMRPVARRLAPSVAATTSCRAVCAWWTAPDVPRIGSGLEALLCAVAAFRSPRKRPPAAPARQRALSPPRALPDAQPPQRLLAPRASVANRASELSCVICYDAQRCDSSAVHARVHVQRLRFASTRADLQAKSRRGGGSSYRESGAESPKRLTLSANPEKSIPTQNQKRMADDGRKPRNQDGTRLASRRRGATAYFGARSLAGRRGDGALPAGARAHSDHSIAETSDSGGIAVTAGLPRPATSASRSRAACSTPCARGAARLDLAAVMMRDGSGVTCAVADAASRWTQAPRATERQCTVRGLSGAASEVGAGESNNNDNNDKNNKCDKRKKLDRPSRGATSVKSDRGGATAAAAAVVAAADDAAADEFDKEVHQQLLGDREYDPTWSFESPAPWPGYRVMQEILNNNVPHIEEVVRREAPNKAIIICRHQLLANASRSRSEYVEHVPAYRNYCKTSRRNR